jgi:hypothetical protein
VGLPRGHTIPLTPLRRLMADLLHFSRKVPLVAIERRMPLADVIAAREALDQRPSWFAIFLKAYALVAEQRPELRQSFMTFPWPRLHQHACNVANLAVARKVGDEDAVLNVQLREPEQWPLTKIDDFIRRTRTDPVEQFGDFRRQLRLARVPWPFRRLAWWATLHAVPGWRVRFAGTFGVTGVAALGSASLHLLSPLTATITYGVFAPDGSAMVRLFYDHRVLDGVQPSAALKELEQMLHGPIVAELRGAMRKAA